MTYRWARWGDVNAFFGLMLDNAAVMIVLVMLTTSERPTAAGRFSRDFVLTQMIPGTALGVVIGDLVYTLLAFQLARRTGRDDVTAMPLGLDTPSAFAVGPLVLLPALQIGLKEGLDHERAMVFAWHVGAFVLLLSGVFKTVVAPFGGAVRRWVPRAGLLGSLAAIALALISFVPLWEKIAALPVVGMVSLTIILFALVAHRRLPGGVPGALAAVLVGVGIYWAGVALTAQCDALAFPPPARTENPAWRLPDLLPAFALEAGWWERVVPAALRMLPIMLPFALATVVGGIDCTESAAAAGDEYDTRTILLTEGIASVAAGVTGGVLQTTPYIGQPAYKTMGGRAAYTLATALFIGAAGLFGWFTHLFDWLPEAALFPILVFVGLEITAQSFHATPTRHYPAVALAVMPALAYLAQIPMQVAFADQTPAPHAETLLLSLRCLANGFIVTSLLWAASLAALLDGKLRAAAVYLLVAGVCSLFGVIHSPLEPAAIAWPHEVWEKMPVAAALRAQSPFHWAAAYGLSALMLLGLSLFRAGAPGHATEQEPKTENF
ncbi:MAG: hypothetical protein U0793_28715 [Gemmataceae bacterium]